MTLFLDQNQIYSILQSELPQDVYPTGSPSAFFSNSDMYAIAGNVKDLYSNLGQIYKNIFPQDADQDIANWEQTVFGSNVPYQPTLQLRQQQVVAKLQLRRGISTFDISTFIANYFPGYYIQVIPQGCLNHSFYWQLDVSKLDYNTALGPNYSYKFNAGTDCTKGWSLDVSKLDVDTVLLDSDVAATMAAAYTYLVKIYGYNPSADQLNAFDIALKAVEPARSSHQIIVNAVNTVYTTVVQNLTQFSQYALIKTDPTSTTGYSGLI